MKRVHLLISGDVTGVGFRLSAVYLAQDLSLTGWVRNTQDDKVEIVAEGPEEKLQNLITWARKGPPAARVDKVDIEWEEKTGEFANFEAR